MTCDKCQLQYIWETVQQLNEGLSWVKLDFTNPSENINCKILSKHFWKGLCKGARYRVEIIKKIEGTNRV